LGFFSELVRAKTLLEEGQIESCLEVLSAIGAEYKRGSYFLDLLGDAFLNKGDILTAARYKTLFEILTKILDSIDHESIAPRDKGDRAPLSPGPPLKHPCQLRPPMLSLIEDEATLAAEGAEAVSHDIMPVTLAIGKQYLAQGHPDLAIAVLEKLREQNPMDRELKDLLSKAKTNKRRDTAVKVLQSWLKKVEKLKAERNTLT